MYISYEKKKEFLESLKDDFVIITHKNCNDGLGCLIACMEYYLNCLDKGTGIKFPEIYFMNYGDELPLDPLGRNILMVDFSLSKKDLENLNNLANNLIVLDHHEHKGKESIEELDFVYIDKSESGTSLAWLFFNIDVYDHNTIDTLAPRYVKHIKDRDLWEWKYSDSKGFDKLIRDKMNLNLDYLELTKQLIDIESDLWKKELDIYSGISKYEDNSALKKAKSILKNENNRINIDGLSIPLANLNALISETGNYISKLDSSKAACLYFITDTHFVFSLRSIEGGPDVSEVAKRFGGGGHVHAAGFSISFDNINYDKFYKDKELNS